MSNMDSTFNPNFKFEYDSTIDLNHNYMVPIGSQTIERIEEIEEIGGVKIFYTKSGKSYAEHQLETIEVVYDYKK